MTQLSNVPMQPNPSALEPLTLAGKLERYHHNLYEKWYYNHKHPYDEGAMDAVEKAINIVKQHQSWRKMPSDEKPQDMQVCNLLVKNESEESPTLYDIGLYRKYKGEGVWLCMTRPEEHIDPSKILAWQPMNEPSNDFFESLQPPSEAQDD